MIPTPMVLALRAHTERAQSKAKRKPSRSRPSAGQLPTWPHRVLLFDTETTADERQDLLFGSYRYCRWTEDGLLACVEEGLFYPDDLPTRDPEGFACLQAYVATSAANVAPDIDSRLLLLSRREFMDRVFYRAAVEGQCLVAGFNLPFDLSRLALTWGAGRRRNRGAFSFELWDYHDQDGNRREHRYRPRLLIRHLDSKRAFIWFGRAEHVGPTNRDETGQPFRGRFVDLKTLSFALTDRGHSLDSACKAFGIEGKAAVPEHGRITPEYIAYNRQDVRASAALLEQLRAEFDRHPIDLRPDQAYSPASIAKAYLRAMGLKPPTARFQSVPPEFLGYAMAAYFGGRAEARIRKSTVPVLNADFTSMYPTVHTLMGLGRHLTARSLRVVDATDEVRALLATVDVHRCFNPTLWRELTWFAEVEPQGDIFPVRAAYAASGQSYNIGVNHLTSARPLWFAGPDVVASALLSGKAPKIRRALRLVAVGQQPGLTPVRLRGEVNIDPREGDIFRRIVEERARVMRRTDLPENEQERLARDLKVSANSGSYGISAELNREELAPGKTARLRVFGLGDSFTCDVPAPEAPGAFHFPPFAALTTAGARLMLALLERCVTDAGGSYAFCDTDSMAIVATEDGGLIPCANGPHTITDGNPAVRALSVTEVERILQRFGALNPYDPEAIPGSILRITKEHPVVDDRPVPLACDVISAKRYALSTGEGGGLALVKPSEHGLGHLLNPWDCERADDKKWIEEVWSVLLRRACGESVPDPDWFAHPAVSRVAITTPEEARALKKAQRGKRRRAVALRPFTFVLAAHVAPLDVPTGTDGKAFRLIAPFMRDPAQWTRAKWIDVHSGRTFGVTTKDMQAPGIVRIKSVADVVAEYAGHPEPKSAAGDGTPCGRRTVGLLARRHVALLDHVYIGKESNELEAVEHGAIHDLDEVLQLYLDPRNTSSLDWLRSLPRAAAAKHLGVAERTVQRLRTGQHRLSPRTKRRIVAAMRTRGIRSSGQEGASPKSGQPRPAPGSGQGTGSSKPIE